MHDEKKSKELSKRTKRMLDEVKHPHPWRSLAVAVVVSGAFFLAAVLGSCQP